MALARNTFLTFYLFALGCFAVIPSYSQEKKAGPIAIPDEPESSPPLPEIFPELRSRIGSLGTPDTSDPAITTLRKYHGVEEYIASDIEDCLQVGRVDYRLWQNFAVLAKLRTPKALKIIGPYLFDEHILQSPVEDVANDSVRARAAIALSHMSLADTASKESGWGGISGEKIEQWKTWWKAHEGNLEQALNSKPEPTKVPEPGAQDQRAIKNNVPPRNVDKINPPVDHSSFPGILPATLGALIVAVAAFLLRRKPEK